MATIRATPLDQGLLKSQRNSVLDSVVLSGFEPLDFAWHSIASTVTNDLIVSRLTHQPSGSFYEFDLLRGKPWARFSPGEERAIETAYPGSWEYQLNSLRSWLDYMRRELDAPDRWSALGDVGREPPATNSAFTTTERARLADHIEQAKGFLRQVETDQNKVALALERLDLLIDAATSQGRRDWWFLAIGVIATIAWDLALDPSKAQQLFDLLLRGMKMLTA